MTEQRALGPRWTEAELRVLFTMIKAIGVCNSSSSGDSGSGQWEKLGENLSMRTPTMIRALFDQHRGYLTQPEASAEGFSAVVADYYKGLGELAGDVQMPAIPSGGTVAAASDADIKMEEVAVESSSVTTKMYSVYNGDQQQHASDQDTDVAKRIRKREDSLTPSSGAAIVSAIASSQVSSSSSLAMKDKKKRKLGRVLAWDATGDQLDRQAQLQLQIKSDDEGGSGPGPMAHSIASATDRRLQHGDAAQSISRTYTKSPSSRSRAHLRDSSLSGRLRGKKFALPWYNWFYSYVDSDFFNHNEFIDCLHRMGLGKINAAARPIWSSVRASMGRPRRLSARFFVQEKAKLDNYRAIKRRIGSHKVLAHVVNLENPRRFAFGTVHSYSPGADKCSVKISQKNGGSVVSCSIDSVMVLDGDSLVKHEHEKDQQQTTTQSQQQPLLNASQHNRGAVPDGSETIRSWTNGDWASTTQLQHQQQEKIRAVLAVKNLLHRKEHLVAALAKLNSHVGAGQQDTNELGRMAINQSVLRVDTSGSWPAAGDRSILQRQYAWIVVNLDITNRSLQEALVRLQECSGNAQAPSSLGLQPSLSMPPLPSQPLAMDLDEIEGSSETLTLQQMKWAVSFLAQSRKRSSDLVATSISQMAQNEGGGDKLPLSNSSTESSPPPLPVEVLPETKQLISTCLCLMSVVRSGTSSTASPGVPPLVTQKLMERLLELLMPRHDDNMDLYAELLSAAEGVQTTLPSTSLT